MSTLTMQERRVPRVVGADTWLRVLLGWRILHTVAVGAGTAWLVTNDAIEGAAAIAGTTAGVIVLLLDVGAIAGLALRRHIGRSLSLAADYLTFVAATVTLLQLNRVFVGLDSLGDTFIRGVPFALVTLLGWVATGVGEGTDRGATVRRVGRIVSYLGAAGFLIAVGLLPGLLTFLSRSLAPLQLTVLLVVLVSAFIAWRTFQPDVARSMDATARSSRTLDGLLFASPNLIGFAAFFAGPLLFSLFVSFTEWDAFGDPEFVGLGNYIRILALTVVTVGAGETAASALPAGYQPWFSIGSLTIGAQDVLFWRSIRNIVVFTLFALPLSTIPALFLATLLNSKAPGIKVFRAIYFVPSIAGVVAVALIWRQLFNSTVGWLNYLISRFVAFWNGLPLVPEMTDPRIQWLSDADVALFSLVIVFSWMFLGYNAVLFLAGLQGLDGTLYEAAMLDGANRWQRFRHITLPGLKPTTFFVVASTGILTLQLFGENVVLFPSTTPIGAGPQNSTLTPVVYLYEQGFRRFAFGYASAVAWVLFLFIFAFTYLQFRRQRDEAGS